MSRVDFYVLPSAGEPARRQFACRLAEKAYRLASSVHICTADAASANQLDELLWTFRDGSFVPHEVVEPGQPAVESPVTIGTAPHAARRADLTINLGADIPPEAAELPRIAEIVSADEDTRLLVRQRYARYRDLGHTLETHKL